VKSHIRFWARSARFAGLITITLVISCALILAACGGADARRLPSISAVGDGAQPALEQNADIAEILAAPVPDGVEPELWDMLKNKLAIELGKKTVAQEWDIELEWSYSSVGIAWTNGFMRPDGSGNGVVDIADLSPIAMHYGSREHRYADYNGDGVVNIADIVELARKFGLSCSGFRVEFSNASAEEGFAYAGTVGYEEYFLELRWVRFYRFPSETRPEHPYWARVWVLNSAGRTIGYRVYEVKAVTGGVPPRCAICDLRMLHESSSTVIWSTKYIITDGNQDGVVNLFDAGGILDWWQVHTVEEPLSAVADYDAGGSVGIEDFGPLSLDFGACIGSFVVEVSATSAEDGFLADGTVDYFDSAGFNEYGFRYYEYTIAAPPENLVYWVRVVPYDIDGDRGEPCEAIEMGGEI